MNTKGPKKNRKSLLKFFLPDYFSSTDEDENHPSLRRNCPDYKKRKWWFLSRIALPGICFMPFIPAQYAVMLGFFLLFVGLSFLDEKR